MDITRIQDALRAHGIDGWLLCDFRNRDFLAYKVLGLEVAKMMGMGVQDVRLVELG